MRKIFEVIISDRPRPVYDIPGKEHAGLNDTPKTWWLYLSEDLPEGTMPPADSDHLQPYQKSTNRLLWEFNIKQHQYTKFKWDEHDVRNSTSVEMFCNKKPIYSFTTSGSDYGLSFAMAKIQYLQVLISEHPYNFFDQESERGRPIYFYGLPAKIRPSSHPGEIHIEADYIDGISKADWWKEYTSRRGVIGNTPQDDEFNESEREDNLEYMQSDSINWGDALSDGNINWFRKVKK